MAHEWLDARAMNFPAKICREMMIARENSPKEHSRSFNLIIEGVHMKQT
jgi:hypothetical protein